MAINLGNINVSDLSDNSYKVVGISINTATNGAGPFQLNYTTLTQARSNLINLILTKKGERVGQPDFGCDIWKILFEQIIDGDIDNRVEQTITDAVSIWLPYILITQIYLDYTAETIDQNGFTVEIDFCLASNPNLTSNVTVNINQ